MKRIFAVAGMFVLVASLSGCATNPGGSLFTPGSGERIIKTTVGGAAVGAAGGLFLGVLGEMFNGGGEHRGGVVAPGYGPGYGHGGYYNSPAEAENAWRYRQQQHEEERRRQEAIWRERYYRRW